MMKYIIHTVLFFFHLNAFGSPLKKAVLSKNKSLVFTYSPFQSFDPLDANTSRNRPLLKLAYSAPMEILQNGGYTSYVFSRFEYNTETHAVLFKLKENIVFSDGSPIQLKDVSLALKRLILASPNKEAFNPVFKNKEWLKKPYPLVVPHQGIVENSKNKTLEIKFMTDIKKPFDRFLTPNLAIMPSFCFDLKKNKLICAIPPQSGRYKIKNFDPSSIEIESKKSGKLFNIIQTSHEDLWSNKKVLKNGSILILKDEEIPHSERENLDRLHKIKGSKVDLSLIWYNNKNYIFKDTRVRQFFSQAFRKELSYFGIQQEGSIFTSIIKGYQSLNTLERNMKPFDEKERASIISFLKENRPRFCHERHSSGTSPIFVPVLKKTYETLGIPFDILKPKTPEEEDKLLENGQIAGIMGHTTINPNNPLGGIKGVFGGTPLSPMVFKGDNIIRLVPTLRHGDVASYYKFNEYVFLEDERSVFSHSFSVMFSSQELPKISFMDILTAPWFLLESEK